MGQQAHGGTHHGYFLPGEGARERAIALFTFPSFADYETYHARFGGGPEFVAADAIRDDSGCVLRTTGHHAARDGLTASNAAKGPTSAESGHRRAEDVRKSDGATHALVAELRLHQQQRAGVIVGDGDAYPASPAVDEPIPTCAGTVACDDESSKSSGRVLAGLPGIHP